VPLVVPKNKEIGSFQCYPMFLILCFPMTPYGPCGFKNIKYKIF
jgi:hypothetical protein